MNPRPAARTFQDLLVWQKAHKFVLGVYGYTSGFPKSETYGLASQFRRAAVSVPANIAEGFRKSGRQDKIRFMNIAQGSPEAFGSTYAIESERPLSASVERLAASVVFGAHAGQIGRSAFGSTAWNPGRCDRRPAA